MAPPTSTFNLDVEAISGICGHVYLFVVFSPQIIQNFQRSSADALSIQFIIAWLLGDVFNIIGAVLQGVLPTMIILAVYYTIADLVLLLQCFYYRGFTWRDEPTAKPKQAPEPSRPDIAPTASETTALLNGTATRERRGSDWSGLSPAVPHISDAKPRAPPTALQTILWNTVVVVMVCAAGVLGWFLGQKATSGKHEPKHDEHEDIQFNVIGQFFGYLCAVAYIASRLPQLILNWRRKTTDGLSMLFFLFACLGNITYVLSIVAYEPKCRQGGSCEPGVALHLYGRYMLVNLSWLLGSFLTLLLDLGVFAQYFMYRSDGGGNQSALFVDDDETSIDEDSWDQRPILQRNDSEYP